MLDSYSNSPRTVRQQAAVSLRTFGWIGFWTQLILTVGSGLVLLFAIADPNLNINIRSGLGLFSALGGILILCFSIYWFFVILVFLSNLKQVSLAYIQVERKQLGLCKLEH